MENANEYKSFLKRIVAIVSDNEFDFLIKSFINYLLELVDTMETLYNAKKSTGMLYVLRGQYEVFLQFEYLNEHYGSSMDECIKRARCYTCFHLMQEKQWHYKLKSKENIEKIDLKLSEYKDISNEYKAAKKRMRYPYWFSLFEGPKSYNELEEHLKYNANENHLYAIASQACHGKTVLRNQLYDITSDIEKWMDISYGLFSIFTVKLIPFSIQHKVDVKNFLLIAIPQIKNKSQRKQMLSQYEIWCKKHET